MMNVHEYPINTKSIEPGHMFLISAEPCTFIGQPLDFNGSGQFVFF